MKDRKAVISSAIYFEPHNTSDEEKAQNEAKFKAWYDDFRKQNAAHFKKAE